MKFVRVSTPKGYRSPHPINMKGYDRLRASQSNQHIYPLLLSLTLAFPIPSAVLLASLRRSRASWVACRLQDNPRSASSDGVPPELAVLGFRGVSAPTGLTGGCSRSDRPTWGFAGEDRLQSARTSAFLCWPGLRQHILHNSMTNLHVGVIKMFSHSLTVESIYYLPACSITRTDKKVSSIVIW